MDTQPLSRCVEQKHVWDSKAPIQMEVCRSIEDCLTTIKRRNNHSPTSVLVTGSLLLVGTFLSAVNFEYRS
jgi:folylpolyglutamate synthase/dihydropteroate synthase